MAHVLPQFLGYCSGIDIIPVSGHSIRFMPDYSYGSLEEALRRFLVPLPAQEAIYQIAVTIDGPIQIVLGAPLKLIPPPFVPAVFPLMVLLVTLRVPVAPIAQAPPVFVNKAFKLALAPAKLPTECYHGMY